MRYSYFLLNSSLVPNLSSPYYTWWGEILIFKVQMFVTEEWHNSNAKIQLLPKECKN